MSFSGLLVQLLNGLASASSLFLVAAGLSLIFGVTRIVNFAHGSFFMVGIYTAYTLVDKLADKVGMGLGFWPALVLAAVAVGVEPARIAKTLSFKQGDGCILIVTAGDGRIDNHKFKGKFSMKASMLPHDDVERLIGHAVGGVCPFGINEGVPVYCDVSMKRFETVFPAAGSDNSAVEMTPDELFKISRSLEWIDVCKLPEGAE